MSRRNAGYPIERSFHAQSDFAGQGLCGARPPSHRLVFGADLALPYYATGAVTCEKCRAILDKDPSGFKRQASDFNASRKVED